MRTIRERELIQVAEDGPAQSWTWIRFRFTVYVPAIDFTLKLRVKITVRALVLLELNESCVFLSHSQK